MIPVHEFQRYGHKNGESTSNNCYKKINIEATKSGDTAGQEKVAVRLLGINAVL